MLKDFTFYDTFIKPPQCLKIKFKDDSPAFNCSKIHPLQLTVIYYVVLYCGTVFI